MSRKIWFTTAVLTAGAAGLVGVGLASRTAEADAVARPDAIGQATGGTLRLAELEDVDSVDPAIAWGAPSWGIEFATCAKLFNYPDAAGAAGTRPMQEVVKAFSMSKDGRTYDFELKRTFRFHTGEAVTAQSFAAAFERDANPRQKSNATGFMREIVGAAAVIDGKAKSISGVRVLGPYRLQIRLTRPLGDFTARLTMPFFCPVLPGTPIDPKGVNDPPGSGPYYVAERIVNRRIVLKRNPYYRGERPANVDEIIVTIGGNAEACLLETEQDRIDYCGIFGLPEDAIGRLAKQYGVNRAGGQFFRNPILATSRLLFNHDRRAFKGPGQIALKKAINYALDRPALAHPVGPIAGKPTDQMLPPALGRDDHIYPIAGPDLAKARRWLARADFKPRKLVLYVGDAAAVLGEVLRADLKRLDIDLEIKHYDPLDIDRMAGTRGEPYDLALRGWDVDYPDAAGFFELPLDPHVDRKGNLNLSYFVDPDVTAAMEAANRLTGEARRRAWADLDADLMRNDPPWAPTANWVARNFVSPSFSCFLWHPVYGVDYAVACKK